MIANLQALRGIAALLVVFVHLEVFVATLGIPPFGHGGVDLFFVLSGFIMVHTTRGRPSAVDFMRCRVARVVPTYWLFTLAIYMVALAAPTLLKSTTTDPAELLKSLAFVPFCKAPDRIYPVLVVGWTLNYEMFFYLLFALSLIFTRRTVGLGLLFAALTSLVLLGLLHDFESAVGRFYTDPVLIEFCLGMLIALRRSQLQQSARIAGRGLLGCIAMLALFGLVLPPFILPGVNTTLTNALPATIVVACAIALDRPSDGQRYHWLVELGGASYSVYLTHVFVVVALQKLGVALGLTPLIAAVGIGVAIPAVILVGWVTHVWIEQPLATFTKRYLVTRNTQRVTPSVRYS